MSFDLNDVDGDFKREELPELPITAMIDIFSMIIIFLILGSVFGSADIKVPASLILPHSKSDESMVAAPELTFHDGIVDAKFLPDSLSQTDLLAGASSIARVKFSQKLKSYLTNVPLSVKTGQKPLNIVAGKNTPYEIIFSIVLLGREAGFENILFVSSFD